MSMSGEGPGPHAALVTDCAVDYLKAARALRDGAGGSDPIAAMLDVSRQLEATTERLTRAFGVSSAAYAIVIADDRADDAPAG